ncbi:type II-A CRISPR-associated protein Csn2 [Bifidobacterium choloepi]|uniref:Type II-A CRISPR-associated protein Csn2 n=1 Tax=Bifidobacterium choloepi TaxID=2614131 RepID=A0A6I5NK22_9BIFI|nr:type II-A CRISPR-associated protein Csn2 [Bifidobacterium choloepi]NEG69212.1 type II-A CRISPR-associated protein Csn2 [Bifidobacterium choloepi]
MIDNITVFPYEPMSLTTGFNRITLGNPRLFFQFIRGLRSEQDNVILSLDNNPVSANHVMLFLGDAATPPDLNSLLLKDVLAKLTESFADIELMEIHDLYANLHNQIQQKVWMEDLPLTLASTFDVKKIISLYKPSIMLEEPASIFEEIRDIVELMGALHEQRTLVMLHITQYCQIAQIKSLHQYLLDQEIQLLDIECTDQHSGLEGIRDHYVDRDYVQFT